MAGMIFAVRTNYATMTYYAYLAVTRYAILAYYAILTVATHAIKADLPFWQICEIIGLADTIGTIFACYT